MTATILDLARVLLRKSRRPALSPPGVFVLLPEPYGARAYAEQCRTLAKGAGHKYIKRVPKAGGGYRYFYDVQHGRGVHHEDHFTVGSAFQVDGGHYHITARDGDKVTVKHDETGETVTMSVAKLRAHLQAHHGKALAAHKEKLRGEIATAKKKGTAAQVKRLQSEHDRVHGKGEDGAGDEPYRLSGVERDVWDVWIDQEGRGLYDHYFDPRARTQAQYQIAHKSMRDGHLHTPEDGGEARKLLGLFDRLAKEQDVEAERYAHDPVGRSLAIRTAVAMRVFAAAVESDLARRRGGGQGGAKPTQAKSPIGADKALGYAKTAASETRTAHIGYTDSKGKSAKRTIWPLSTFETKAGEPRIRAYDPAANGGLGGVKTFDPSGIWDWSSKGEKYDPDGPELSDPHLAEKRKAHVNAQRHKEKEAKSQAVEHALSGDAKKHAAAKAYLESLGHDHGEHMEKEAAKREKKAGQKKTTPEEAAEHMAAAAKLRAAAKGEVAPAPAIRAEAAKPHRSVDYIKHHGSSGMTIDKVHPDGSADITHEHRVWVGSKWQTAMNSKASDTEHRNTAKFTIRPDGKVDSVEHKDHGTGESNNSLPDVTKRALSHAATAEVYALDLRPRPDPVAVEGALARHGMIKPRRADAPDGTYTAATFELVKRHLGPEHVGDVKERLGGRSPTAANVSDAARAVAVDLRGGEGRLPPFSHHRALGETYRPLHPAVGGTAGGAKPAVTETRSPKPKSGIASVVSDPAHEQPLRDALQNHDLPLSAAADVYRSASKMVASGLYQSMGKALTRSAAGHAKRRGGKDRRTKPIQAGRMAQRGDTIYSLATALLRKLAA